VSVEVSFILPCLNEAATVEHCIRAAQRCIERHGLAAEIIVADNGSHDGSQAIAAQAGARVVPVAERGYGNALIGGFEAARGRWLIMGDADESYDFAEAMPMIEALRAGADLVMGSRFRGRIEPGAMPFLHRWLGNPALSLLGRLLFHAPVSDFHCGMRGLSQEAFRKLGLRTGGMEIASEMVVKAATRKMRIVEVPITLHRDGRGRPPHLRTWRDGWRHLRFMVVLSPRFALLLPGLVLMGIGALALASLAGGVREWRGVSFGVHTMVVASLLVIVGYQAVTTAIAARIFAVSEEIGPPAPWMQRAFGIFTLERGLLAGALLATLGLAGIALPAWRWAEAGFPPLDPVLTLRPVILGATIAAVGIQTLLMSIVYSMLGISRRRGG
jgi:glycosyltransferase involved in cell wall biosynthesis